MDGCKVSRWWYAVESPATTPRLIVTDEIGPSISPGFPNPFVNKIMIMGRQEQADSFVKL